MQMLQGMADSEERIARSRDRERQYEMLGRTGQDRRLPALARDPMSAVMHARRWRRVQPLHCPAQRPTPERSSTRRLRRQPRLGDRPRADARALRAPRLVGRPPPASCSRLIGIAAVFVQGPLRRVVEIPIVVDRVTGETTIQQRLSVETIPPMEALDKHNLATFVRAREGYSWMFLQRDFDQVARMAVPAVFADYNRQFEGDAALQKKIGAGEDWRINDRRRAPVAIGPQRQPRRGDGHLRQGRAARSTATCPTSRRATSRASSSSTSRRCWPRSATGSRTRSGSSSPRTDRIPRSTPRRREPKP